MKFCNKFLLHIAIVFIQTQITDKSKIIERLVMLQVKRSEASLRDIISSPLSSKGGPSQLLAEQFFCDVCWVKL